MMNLKQAFIVVGLVMFGVSAVTAAPIAIQNASFEEPALDPGAWTDVNLNWGDDAGDSNADGFTEHIVGFAADGVNHTGLPEGAEQSQNLGVSLLPNYEYTLTVAVGNRNAAFTVPGNESRFGLYVGGNAQGGGKKLADVGFDASVLAESTFADISLSYVAPDSPPAGDLWISLQSTGVNRAHFDNIRLDAVVPEPSSLTLLGLATLGLLIRRRRR